MHGPLHQNSWSEVIIALISSWKYLIKNVLKIYVNKQHYSLMRIARLPNVCVLGVTKGLG